MAKMAGGRHQRQQTETNDSCITSNNIIHLVFCAILAYFMFKGNSRLPRQICSSCSTKLPGHLMKSQRTTSHPSIRLQTCYKK